MDLRVERVRNVMWQWMATDVTRGKTVRNALTNKRRNEKSPIDILGIAVCRLSLFTTRAQALKKKTVQLEDCCTVFRRRFASVD